MEDKNDRKYIDNINNIDNRGKTILAKIADEHFDERALDFADELMLLEGANAEFLYNQSKEIANMVVEFKELMMVYSCAIKEIRTKIEILNAEYNVRYRRNPINSINHRLKSSASIVEKLERKGIPFSISNIEKRINDVAGLRVICSYMDDIYVIADALKKQDDVMVIAEKDYIANPKPNGYRSLHLIVSVPVFFTSHTKQTKVEIQIRTIAMDFWATLEHQMKYRQHIANSDTIAEKLKRCATTIAETDARMLEIRKQIESNTTEPSEEDILFEKIRRIDLSVD